MNTRHNIRRDHEAQDPPPSHSASDDEAHRRIMRKDLQVPYAKRSKNKRLQSYSRKHLHSLIGSRGLYKYTPVKGLRNWQLIHLLECDRVRREFHKSHRMYKVDPRRPGIMDLPGEIRNQIYSLTILADDSPLPYFKTNFRHGMLRWGYQREYIEEVSAVEALEKWSWINHAIRNEARSFFYSRHMFCVSECDSIPAILTDATIFLRDIKADGRASLAHLAMRTEYDFIVNSTYQIYRDFYAVFKECTNLRSMDLDIHIQSLLAESQSCVGNQPFWSDFSRRIRLPQLHAFLSCEHVDAALPKFDFDDIVATFSNMKRLETLRVQYVLEGNTDLVGPVCPKALEEGITQGLEAALKEVLKDTDSIVSFRQSRRRFP